MKNNLGVTLSYAPWLIEIKKAPYPEPFFEVIVRVIAV